ncbi:BamA/TamA family outer membrane protein [uncultured Fibrella sp.]|uniref:BamA/TamA family outer membrane protein n=1 Tax=uncultured Fibrella sp. TaxID=1284596 RepID=UPI0035CB2349
MVFPLRYKRYLFGVLLLITTPLCAQMSADSTSRPSQLDAFDLAKRWFGISILPKADSGLSTKPQWALLPSLNYQPATGIAGGLILTSSFYPKETPRTRISTIHLYAGYSQFNQVLATAISNLWTTGHRYNIQTDWRFYNFPTITYGLGTRTQLANASDVDYNHIRFHQTIYKAVGRDYMVGVGYMFDRHYDIQNIAIDGQITDFARYGLARQATSSGMVVGLLRDRRGNPNNPEGGSYLLAQYRVYVRELGSTVNYQAAWLDYRKYIPLPGRLEKQLAIWSFNWVTFGGNAPYLDLPSTGWDTYNNSGRGYALGRLRGPSLYYAEAEYRTQLTANGLIGGVLFANAQTIGPWPNGVPAGLESTTQSHTTQVWPGFGGGLRVKVNKSARTNLAIDYAFGAGGSKGLYFNLNEVF